MDTPSRTPEGVPGRCPICGAKVRLEPSAPLSDAPCPNCGHLIWFAPSDELIGQTRTRIRDLVADIHKLASSDVPADAFYRRFLQDVVSAVAALGGALWIVDNQGQPRMQHEIDFLKAAKLDPSCQSVGHDHLLRETLRDGKATLFPSTRESASRLGGHESGCAVIAAPLKVNQQPVGVVELLLDPNRRRAALENATLFVTELCDMASTYLLR